MLHLRPKFNEHQHIGVILLWSEVVASLCQTEVPEWKLESHVQTWG